MTGVLLKTRGMMRKGLFLTACLAVAVAVLALPAYGISGLDGLFGLTAAALLCLVPGWLVFAIHSRYGTAAPTAVLLIGMLGRMFVTLFGAIAILETWPELGMRSFGLWLGVFYMLSLFIETRLLLTPPLGGISPKDSTK